MVLVGGRRKDANKGSKLLLPDAGVDGETIDKHHNR